MSQNKFALARYRLIDSLLRKHDFVKTKDIVERCIDELGFNVTQRTIQLDMCALKEDPFVGCYFPIEYDNYKKAYFYYETPPSFFLSICITENEYNVLDNLRIFLKNKIPDDDYDVYCSFLPKIQNNISTKNI
ncbi:MAG: hypothetical protein LBP67_03930 [Bacteroidales bacterium]|jgi:hypothetical protein|nr:hypothetical protein [Bacteroidales bacterium]